MRVQRLATVPVFAEILKVWGAIPLVRLASNFGFDAVGSQITCQISLKSESVGFKFSVILGDPQISTSTLHIHAQDAVLTKSIVTHKQSLTD